jgi:hypothetical protein
MTRPALRLVLDQEKDTDARTADWPSAETTGLHIHLHIGTPDQQNARPTETSPPAASAIQGTSGRSVLRPIMLGVAGVFIVLVAFEVGARSGEGHARAIASSPTNTAALASIIPGLQSLPSASANEMPAALRQQLAQPPTVTAPPGPAVSAGAQDAFGLQR